MAADPVRLDPGARARLERLGFDFLAQILRRELHRRPDNLDALQECALALTRLGRHVEALALDARLAELMPDDAGVAYNLACSLALVGRTRDALAELERAVELGYDDADHLAADDDLTSLHGHVRFHELLGQLRRRAR